MEWARYTGRHVCSELIDSVQKSCSSHIRDRWTSDPDLKSHSSTSLNTLGHGDKESWLKHKVIKKKVMYCTVFYQAAGGIYIFRPFVFFTCVTI